jgi:hypothetical protein
MAKPLKKQIGKIPAEKTSANVRTTKDIVREHLADENHKISEEDMKVKIDLDLPTDEAHAPLPIKNDNKRPHDSDKDHDILTSWDVIKE